MRFADACASMFCPSTKGEEVQGEAQAVEQRQRREDRSRCELMARQGGCDERQHGGKDRNSHPDGLDGVADGQQDLDGPGLLLAYIFDAVQEAWFPSEDLGEANRPKGLRGEAGALVRELVDGEPSLEEAPRGKAKQRCSHEKKHHSWESSISQVSDQEDNRDGNRERRRPEHVEHPGCLVDAVRVGREQVDDPPLGPPVISLVLLRAALPPPLLLRQDSLKPQFLLLAARLHIVPLGAEAGIEPPAALARPESLGDLAKIWDIKTARAEPPTVKPR